MPKSKGINRPRWRPSEADREYVRARFSTTRTQELADHLGVQYHQVAKLASALGLFKDPAFLNGPLGGRTDGVRGMGTRFQKGQVPWTKGRRMPAGWNEATRFKPGQRSHNYKPIGSLRIAGGYLQRKVDDSGYSPRDWTTVHRLVWEAAHGAIPAKHVVVFKPGQKTTELELITPDRLECITRTELAKRNGPIGKHPEMARVYQLKGAITRQLNRIKQQHQEATA